jgi:hypothetical protein
LHGKSPDISKRTTGETFQLSRRSVAPTHPKTRRDGAARQIFDAVLGRSMIYLIFWQITNIPCDESIRMNHATCPIIPGLTKIIHLGA